MLDISLSFSFFFTVFSMTVMWLCVRSCCQRASCVCSPLKDTSSWIQLSNCFTYRPRTTCDKRHFDTDWHIASSTLLIFARYAFKYRCPLKNWMNLWCWCIHSLMLRIRLAGNWRICNYTAAVFFNKIFCFQNRALKIRKCRLGLSPTHKIKYNVNELELELDKCNSLETVKH